MEWRLFTIKQRADNGVNLIEFRVLNGPEAVLNVVEVESDLIQLVSFGIGTS